MEVLDETPLTLRQDHSNSLKCRMKYTQYLIAILVLPVHDEMVNFPPAFRRLLST